jgi:hypothetical protein
MTMPTKTLDTIDRELHEIVDAVEQAANWGMAHRDQPQAVEKTLADCEEMLRHVMKASILED